MNQKKPGKTTQNPKTSTLSMNCSWSLGFQSLCAINCAGLDIVTRHNFVAPCFSRSDRSVYLHVQWLGVVLTPTASTNFSLQLFSAPSFWFIENLSLLDGCSIHAVTAHRSDD
ncbi:uncharacterized protein [Physcomitrium patens]|uniref:uncharacterized protein n=1 Tax=Physcomitrium patens TaxID=3218 RepID=UPI000D1576C3|nr:uncharacterized protein LOC112276926 [Physcomitrium patens]|eukprot:XP_024364513.1 uncharacterized protein LOC112276926 [Physcomitrella patens]